MLISLCLRTSICSWRSIICCWRSAMCRKSFSSARSCCPTIEQTRSRNAVSYGRSVTAEPGLSNSLIILFRFFTASSAGDPSGAWCSSVLRKTEPFGRDPAAFSGTCFRAHQSSSSSRPAHAAPDNTWSHFDTLRETPAMSPLSRCRILADPAVVVLLPLSVNESTLPLVFTGRCRWAVPLDVCGVQCR